MLINRPNKKPGQREIRIGTAWYKSGSTGILIEIVFGRYPASTSTTLALPTSQSRSYGGAR